MKLPQFKAVIIPERKIVAYLLSSNHTDGKWKAIFFSRFGFEGAQW